MTKLTCKLWPEEIEYIKECITKRMSWAAIAAWLMDIFWLKMTPQWVNYQMRKLSAGKAINEYSVGNDTELWNIKRMRHKTTLADWSKVSALIENPQGEQELNALRDSILEDVKKYAPKYPIIKRTQSKDWHLLVIDPADIHLGKLCDAFETWDTYNNQIAIQRVKEWVQGILDKTAWYKIDKILFVWGNDILHIDWPGKATTAGTPQDVDWLWHSNFMLAKQLYIDVLEMCLAVADVDFVFNPSNHDWTHWFFLCQLIAAWFDKNKNISFDVDMRHRKYYQYGKNMIGTTHGDSAKHANLAILAATEQPIMWSQTLYRVFYCHHVHSKHVKDYIWLTVETMRSPSGIDWWHHRSWYVWAPKAIEWFIHHPEFWPIAKFTHMF